MCGRFTEFSPAKALMQAFDLSEIPFDFKPSYNVAPGQDVLTIVNENGIQLRKMRWGLVPQWAKDVKIGYKMINARAETINEKPSYRAAFRKRRCLIAADGFYEWSRQGSVKIPYYFKLRTDDVMAFAGIYETWAGGGEMLTTCSIITTTANELVKPVHPRMPVIVPKLVHPAWLENEVEQVEALHSLLCPFDSGKMIAFPVGQLVNSPYNNTDDLIQPLSQ